MRVSSTYLRKINKLTCVVTFNLCRCHPVVMYEVSKDCRP